MLGYTWKFYDITLVLRNISLANDHSTVELDIWVFFGLDYDIVKSFDSELTPV